MYLVTTLADSGPGSLRACAEAAGPRTCVFTTSGVIALRSTLEIKSSYLTIAGQTAPGGGIAIRVANLTNDMRVFSIEGRAHDVVIRYLRVWGDAVPSVARGRGTSGVRVWGGSYDVIVDHCTLLWHSCAAFGVWADGGSRAENGRCTLSWSLLGENTQGTTGTPQSTPILTAAASYDPTLLFDVDFHHNVIASGDHRNPSVNGRGRIVNNVVYNFARAVSVESGGADPGSHYDIIGNHFRPGPMTPRRSPHREIMSNWGVASLFLANNRSDWRNGWRGTTDGTERDGGWARLTGGSRAYQGTPDVGTPLPQQYKRDPWTRLAPPSSGLDITAEPVAGLMRRLVAPGAAGASRRLRCDGTWVNVSDSARDRILAYVQDGTGPRAPPTDAARANGGALPAIAVESGCADTDRDGMPDTFEVANALDKDDPTDGAIVRADGYTNLEHFLNGR